MLSAMAHMGFLPRMASTRSAYSNAPDTSPPGESYTCKMACTAGSAWADSSLAASSL